MELEQGWWRCERCRGLVSSNHADVSWTCIDGTGHVIRDETWEYMVPAGDPPPGFQPQWRQCSQCACLFYRDFSGICMATGGQHVPAVFASGAYPQTSEYSYSVPFGEYPDTEPGWRWCNKCQGLWTLSLGEAGPCKHESGLHDPAGSNEYRLFRKASGVRGGTQCSACQSLVMRSAGPGCVTEDGTHPSYPGMSTLVSFGGRRSDAEPGWTMCRNCSSLFLGGPSAGVCRVPADDGSARPHDGRGSLPYLVTKDVAPIDELPGWRHCAKCALLTYTFQELGPCPAGAQHDTAASAKYSTLAGNVQTDGLTGVHGWRRCAKCRSLVLRAVDDGICRDGGVHDLSGSLSYLLNDYGGYEFETASWCHRCQALVSVTREDPGVCHDGGGHDTSYRFVVGVPRDVPPDPGEPGWRLCVTCCQFVLTDAGTPLGACANGGTHDATGSAEYVLGYQKPLPQVSPNPANGTTTTTTTSTSSTQPAITCAESAEAITVTGVRFSPDQPVQVVVNLPGAPAMQKTRTAADGGFSVTFTPVEEAPGNALVEATDDSFLTARARLATYRPVVA